MNSKNISNDEPIITRKKNVLPIPRTTKEAWSTTRPSPRGPSLLGSLQTHRPDKPRAIRPLPPFAAPASVHHPIAFFAFGKTVIRAITASSLNCASRSEEHTSELQSRGHLVCLLL